MLRVYIDLAIKVFYRSALHIQVREQSHVTDTKGRCFKRTDKRGDIHELDLALSISSNNLSASSLVFTRIKRTAGSLLGNFGSNGGCGTQIIDTLFLPFFEQRMLWLRMMFRRTLPEKRTNQSRRRWTRVSVSPVAVSARIKS